MQIPDWACLALVSLAISTGTVPAAWSGERCNESGVWLDATHGTAPDRDALFSDLVDQRFVLLGETHTSKEHHRWQLHTLAALHSRVGGMVIGFEMFPRRVQPTLDRWVRGELTKQEFLDIVDWRGIWGYSADLYMPLFDFARMHRIPMVALNVDRALVSRIGDSGWDAIAPDEREGISRPAAASASYEKTLAEVYRLHASHHASESGQPEKTAVTETPGFRRFVEAQLTWDRAMAQGLADAHHQHPDSLIVGIMGSGHLANFHGVPHQLRDLGHTQASVLIPVEADKACNRLGQEFADVLFTVEARDESEPKPLRLGVMLSDAQGAALVDAVTPDSVARQADLRADDRIVNAAGVKIPDSAALIAVIARQAPGTWLPLTVERNGATIDLLAKFPATGDSDS